MTKLSQTLTMKSWRIYLLPKIRFGGREGYEISKRIHTIIAKPASGADDKKQALENTWQETDFEKLI